MSREISDELRLLIHDPNVIEKLVESTAPKLIGYSFEKLATLYYLVGGSLGEGISVLLVGDNGTGKSQLLKWIARILDKKVMDHLTMDVCSSNYVLLENVNRLQNKEQRILEAYMIREPAGSVYATSRPLLGKYNHYKTVMHNIRLPPGLLSLFNLVFVLRDIPDRERDHRMAMRLLGQIDDVDYPLDTELLFRYLESARAVNPVLSGEARSVLHDFYMELRSQSVEDESVAVTPWELVTLRKLSEANAKLHHRETVSALDAEAAVSMLSYYLEQVGVYQVRRKYDVDAMYTRRPALLNSRLIHVAEAFMELEKVTTPVRRIDLESMLWERYGMTRRTVLLLLRTLLEQGFITEEAPGQYKRKEWDEDGF